MANTAGMVNSLWSPKSNSARPDSSRVCSFDCWLLVNDLPGSILPSKPAHLNRTGLSDRFSTV